MSYILKSRMYREELLRWILIVALGLWAITASVAYLRMKPQTIVIGVSDDASYLIETESKAHVAKEKVLFLSKFIDSYYAFDEKTFDMKMTRAGDFMSQDLWQIKQPEILKVKAALIASPYTQTLKVLNIDDLGEGKVEAMVLVGVTKKLTTGSARVKITMRIQDKLRDLTSAYPFEVTEFSDATL